MFVAQGTYHCDTMKQACFIGTTDFICKKLMKQVGQFCIFPLFSIYSISTVLAVWPSFFRKFLWPLSIWTLQNTHHLVKIQNHWSRASSVFGFSLLCFSFWDVSCCPLWHACSFHSTSYCCMTLAIVNFGSPVTIEWWWLVLSGFVWMWSGSVSVISLCGIWQGSKILQNQSESLWCLNMYVFITE
jgi:hypothetical protein